MQAVNRIQTKTLVVVMLGPVPSICNGLILFTVLDPRDKPEDDDGAGENPSPTPPHKGEGLALPLPPTPRNLASARLNCGTPAEDLG
ncbi:hypothetical protein M2360_004875 [Rhizobium sp. SG_E_25_P2]|nr:hypothetical protein [Rhizobium sp. SG_E_25_P2]